MKEDVGSTVEYFDGDVMAATVWEKKYALRDENGEAIEHTPTDMHHRMAKYFADVEAKYDIAEKGAIDKSKLSEYGQERKPLTEEEIFKLFDHFKYVVPGGSVMSGLGSALPVSLSNCWVIDSLNDSIEGIFNTCNEMSQLFKRRGGVGFDISKLRPSGAKVNNSAKYSTGAVSFMDLFSTVTTTIAQCGRRGAAMLSIHIDHPDAKEFIEKKQDLTKVTGANISVQIGDDFMNAVINDTDFYQTWPIDKKVNVDESAEYDTLVETTDEDGNKAYFKKIRAKELWNTLVHCAWNTAEPGILFKTKHYNYSPDGIYDRFRGTSTNPCGEIFMKEDSCRLIHVNFSSFIKDEYEDNASIDSEKLYQVVYETIRLGDDLVDLEADAITRILKKIENDGDKEKGEYKMYSRLLDNTLQGRRCGVGFFGLADALAKLGIKFDSDEGLAKIGELMDIFYKAQLDSEIDMAVTRGAFPAYSNELEKNATSEWYTYLAEHYPEQYERMMKYGRRNVSFGTCAPTGSVAMLARCSSGIEPIFMPFYTRRVKCTNDSDRVDFVDRDGEKFTEYVTAHPTLQKWAEKKIGDTSSWSPKEWQDAYEKSPWFGSTANDIDWSKRIEVQAIVQKDITHSISSCVVPDTLIELDNGGYVYIDELFDFHTISEGEFADNKTFDRFVKTHDGTFNRIKSFYNNGAKDVFEVSLTNGLKIQCTSNERFMVYNESKSDFDWKHLYELNEGDIIKIQ